MEINTINNVNLKRDVIEKIVASELFIAIDNLYEPKVTVHLYQWKELLENNHIDYDLSVVNSLYDLYKNINMILDSPAYHYIDSININLDKTDLLKHFL